MDKRIKSEKSMLKNGKTKTNYGNTKSMLLLLLCLLVVTAITFPLVTKAQGGEQPTMDQKVIVKVKTSGLNDDEQEFDNSILQEDLRANITYTNGVGVTSAKKEILLQHPNYTGEITMELPANLGTGRFGAELLGVESKRFIMAESTSKTLPNSVFEFTIELVQITNPIIKLDVNDPYGNQAMLSEALKANLKISGMERDGFDIPFTISRHERTFNVKAAEVFGEDGISDTVELNYPGDDPVLTIQGETAGGLLTLGGVEYKVVKSYSVDKGGQITLTSQPKVMAVPPEQLDKPVPAGYVRVTFDPTAEATDPTATAYDVKEGLTWDEARQAIPDKVVEPAQPTHKNNKGFEGWFDGNSKLADKNGPVTGTTFTARYLSTSDKIKALGGLESRNFGVFVETDVNAKDFWKQGIQVAKTVTDAGKKADIEGYFNDADTSFEDLSSRTTATENLNPDPGKIKVTFKDGSSIEVENQRLYVWAKKTENTEENKDTPKPYGTVQVSFAKGTGVSALAPTDKTMTVESGQTLADSDFPQVTLETDYKNAVWTGKAGGLVVSEINNVFTANASKKTASDLIAEAGGLKAVDIAVWKGDNINWSKGVALADKGKDTDGRLQTLLDAATVTDRSGRNSTSTGESEGTLLVKFADSEIEVAQQKLYVSDHVIPSDQQNVPSDAVKIQLMLGEGVKVEKKDPNSGQVTESQKGDKDQPLVYRTYLAKPGTDLGTYKHPQLHETILNLVGVQADEGYENPTWSGEDHNNPKNYIVSEQNKVFVAAATKKGESPDKPEDKPGNKPDGKPGNESGGNGKGQNGSKDKQKPDSQKGKQQKVFVPTGRLLEINRNTKALPKTGELGIFSAQSTTIFLAIGGMLALVRKRKKD